MSKNVFRLSFTLLSICVVCTALVVAAHDYTNSIIAEREAAKVAESYIQVFPQAGKLEKIPAPADSPIKEIYRSAKGSGFNGYIYTVAPKGYAGEITIMVGIEKPSMKITGVKILSQKETPGLGAKCTEPAFLDQFLSKDLHQPLVVSKDAQKPQEIQAITASTITSKAVVSGINIASAHFRANYIK
ncbi:MAG: RnfABCDGE type electron transport complex subunit G [Acidaminococcaceae bacterium]